MLCIEFVAAAAVVNQTAGMAKTMLVQHAEDVVAQGALIATGEAHQRCLQGVGNADVRQLPGALFGHAGPSGWWLVRDCAQLLDKVRGHFRPSEEKSPTGQGQAGHWLGRRLGDTEDRPVDVGAQVLAANSAASGSLDGRAVFSRHPAKHPIAQTLGGNPDTGSELAGATGRNVGALKWVHGRITHHVY